MPEAFVAVVLNLNEISFVPCTLSNASVFPPTGVSTYFLNKLALPIFILVSQKPDKCILFITYSST
jgi:hypothetical protein